MPKRKTPEHEENNESEQAVTSQTETEPQAHAKDAESETSGKGRKKAAPKKTARKAASTKSKAKSKAEETSAADQPAKKTTRKKAASKAEQSADKKEGETAAKPKRAATKRATSKRATSKKAATASETPAEAQAEAASAEGTEAEVVEKPKRTARKATSKKAASKKTADKKAAAKTTHKATTSQADAAVEPPAEETTTPDETAAPGAAPAAPESARKTARSRKTPAKAKAAVEAEDADAANAPDAKAEAAGAAKAVSDEPISSQPKKATKRSTSKRSTTKRKETAGAKATAADSPETPAEAEAPAAPEQPTLGVEPLVLQRSKAKAGQRAEDEELPLGELNGVEAVDPANDILAGPIAGPQPIADLPELEALSELPPTPKLDDPAQEMLLEQLREIGRPIHVKDLEKSFTRREANVVGGWRDINEVLDELTHAGLVVRTRRRTYGLPGAMNLVRGRFQASSAGFGFVVPDTGRDDYYVPAEDTMEAWNGDTVLVRPEGRGPRGGGRGRGGRGNSRAHTPRHGNPQATVVRIVERKASQLVGTLEFSYGHPILKADDFRARHRIFVLPDEAERLEAGSRVVVKLYWPEDTGEDEVFGEIVRVLGEQDDPATETEAVMVTYGLRGEFPNEVLAEAQAIPREIPAEALAGRMDLRAANTFTVDGRDAKDFDDAIHIQATERGTFIIGVHIADVSHYVRAGSELDKEAYARATSVYLPGRVLPMLTEHLSNGVCSLVPSEDRLTMSALVELSSDAEILDVQLTPSVIHSKARLTYDDVQAYSEATAPLPEHARALEGDLHLLLKMAAKLRSLRLRDGSLNFKLREVKVDIDDEGHLELTELREETARGMIEDLMLLANKVVAKFLTAKGIPALFRIHEEPTLQRFQEVASALGRLGLGFPGGEPSPQAYQTVLGQVRGTPRESVVNTLLLRSMQQAKYSPENLGHFGLAFEDYLHFTSPIRRYPDLLVHRILREVLAGHLEGGAEEAAELRAILPAMAEHTSERERAATEAERDLTKYYQAKWAERFVGQSFMGRVSGVAASGLFVALENGVEGKLHISNLEDDYYIYLEDAQILKGRSRGRIFRLGDAVAVTISGAKPLARQIDFTVHEEGTELSVIGEDDEEPDPSGPRQKQNNTLGKAAPEGGLPTHEELDPEIWDEEENEYWDELNGSDEMEDDMSDEQHNQGRRGRARSRRRGDRRGGSHADRQPEQQTEQQPEQAGAPHTQQGRQRGHGRGKSSGKGRNGSGKSRSSGSGRIVTLERTRNEHSRPVNITAQRMYFGDWSVDQMPEDDERGGGRQDRRGNGRGKSGGRRRSQSRGKGGGSSVGEASARSSRGSGNRRRKRRNRSKSEGE